MFQDFKDLLSAFNAHGVKYLIVGGYAVAFHAQPRATKDIDLFIKADAANAKATYAALTSFGASLDKVRAEDLPIRIILSASDGNRSPSIFIPASTESNLTPRGNGASRASSTRKAVSRRFSSPRKIWLRQKLRRAACVTLPTLRKFGKPRGAKGHRQSRSPRNQATPSLGIRRSLSRL